MNEPNARLALQELAEAASELAAVCDRDVTEFAMTWHAVARNARVLEGETDLPMVRADVESLLGSIASLFSYHPGAFTEMYISRPNFDEQMAENVKFDALKDRVSAAAGALREALTEGEVNTLAVRRHLTTLESFMLEFGLPAEASRLRALLNAPEIDCLAAAQLGLELSARTWQGPARVRLPPLLAALEAELAAYVTKASH